MQMKITDALIAEHTIFLGVFAEIERVLPSLAGLVEVATMARIVEGMLRGHAARETELAFLALDHALAEKGHLDRMHHDHREIDGRLQTIFGTHSCPEARRLLKSALLACREHFRLEERILFPLLERTLKPETLVDLGRTWVDREPEPACIPNGV
jgi:hypothetical protein